MNAFFLALQMGLEGNLKDPDEWLFLVFPQLLVLELEYFSLLASKTLVHKQLLVSIVGPHPQIGAKSVVAFSKKRTFLPTFLNISKTIFVEALALLKSDQKKRTESNLNHPHFRNSRKSWYKSEYGLLKSGLLKIICQ